MASNDDNCVYKSESLSKMVYPRVFSSPIVHENVIYVVGGCDQMGQPVDSFEMYDITKRNGKPYRTCQLSEQPQLLVSLEEYASSFPDVRERILMEGLVGDKIVAIGGVGDVQQPVDAVEMYSIKDKKWTEMQKLPSGLLGISSVLRDDRVLVVGGMGTDTNPHESFSMINLEENKWKEMKSMPTGRYATFSFLVNEKLYVIGGRVGKEPSLAFEVYDFAEDIWRKLPDVPSKRVFAMYAATNKYIVSIGGLIQPGKKGFSDVCEVFDLEKEEWKIGQNMPTKRGDFAIGVIEDKIVCAGGLGNTGKPFTSTEIYDIETDKWSQGKDMSMSHCSCAYITHHGKLYVIGGLSAQGPTNCAECISYGPLEEEGKGRRAQPGAKGKKKQS